MARHAPEVDPNISPKCNEGNFPREIDTSFPAFSALRGNLQRLFISEALYYQQSNSVTWKHGDYPPKMSHPSHIDTIPQRLSDLRLEEAFSAHGQSGHRFVRKTFTRPSYCHHCTDLLWGLTNQGLICEGREHKDTVPCFGYEEITCGICGHRVYNKVSL